MSRVTMGDLQQLAIVINRTLDIVPHIDPMQSDDYYVQTGYGRVRLVRRGGSVEVSPSLSRPELYLWMRAFLEGILVGMEHERAGQAGLLQGPPEDGGSVFIVPGGNR